MIFIVYLYFFLYCSLIYFLYKYRKCSECKNVKNNLNHENVLILKKLGYYNLNINALKMNYIVESLFNIMFLDNINYTFNKIKINNNISIDKLYDDFNKYCNLHNKNKYDMSFNELIAYIKNTDDYINYEKNLTIQFKRAVILSRYIYDKNSDNLINNLELHELEKIINQ